MADVKVAKEILTSIESCGDSTWKGPVANAGALPTTGNLDGDVRIALDTHTILI